MPTLKVKVKTKFGEIEVSGESPDEVLEALGWLKQDFVSEVNERVSDLMVAQAEDNLRGIIRNDKEGPTIVTTEELSHYESIGLIMYAMKNKEASSKQIRTRLNASGKKVVVPARLNEMRKREHIFKPNSKRSEYKLTSRGVKWVETEIIKKLAQDKS